MSRTPSKYDVRYGDNWEQVSKQTRKLTHGRCCNCGKTARQNERAMDVHHLYYGIRVLGLILPVTGFEIPGWQLVPLCRVCHLDGRNSAHSKRNYITSPTNPVWHNRNTALYAYRIRFKLFCKMVRFRLLFALLLALGLILLFAKPTACFCNAIG